MMSTGNKLPAPTSPIRAWVTSAVRAVVPINAMYSAEKITEYGRACYEAGRRVAFGAKRTYDAVVRVCPECDIADCRHIRGAPRSASKPKRRAGSSGCRAQSSGRQATVAEPGAGAVDARLSAIEDAVAANTMTPAAVFTQMRQLIAASATPSRTDPPADGREAVAWQGRTIAMGVVGGWKEVSKREFDEHLARDWKDPSREYRALYTTPPPQPTQPEGVAEVTDAMVEAACQAAADYVSIQWPTGNAKDNQRQREACRLQIAAALAARTHPATSGTGEEA